VRFQQIYDWIETNKPEVICEVGTWNGLNAAQMMSFGAKQYIGFDLWEDGDEVIDELENNSKKRVPMETAEKNLKKHKIELIKGNTRDTLKAYAKDKAPFIDMALIDGGHSKGTIKSDLLAILRIVKRNGVIFIDDFYFGCKDDSIGAQSALVDFNVPFTVLPMGDKARGNMIVKVVKIALRDVPTLGKWDIPSKIAWQFNPPLEAA